MKNLNFTNIEHASRLNLGIGYQILLRYRLDILIAITLAVIAGFACYSLTQTTEAVRHINEVWFRGDCSLVYRMMVSPETDAYRRIRHPLLPLMAPLLVFLGDKLLGLNSDVAVTVIFSLTASLWIFAIFVLLKALGCRRIDATLLSLLALVSAASMFWFTVPESYPWGSLTIVIGLIFSVLVERIQVSPLWYLAINVITISITVTNWMVAIFITFFNHSRRQALQIMGGTIGLTALPMIGYRVIRPFIFGTVSQGSISGAVAPEPASKLGLIKSMFALDFLFILDPISSIQAFLFHSMLMPAFKIDATHALYTQDSIAGSGGSVWSHVAVLIWPGLLALGCVALLTLNKHYQFRFILGLTLLAQFVLHLMFGDETFLFTLHFIPLFISLIALGTLTRNRLLILAMTSVLILSAGINNFQQFEKATDFLKTIASIHGN